MNVLIDLMFTNWPDPVKIADPDRTAIILDHAVPAPSARRRERRHHGRARVRPVEFAIEKFFDVGRHGICHQVIAENALALPGQVLTCTDSHTCAGGAYNTAARGLGPAEVIADAVHRPDLVHRRPDHPLPARRATLPAGVGGKDVFLHLAGACGDAANHNLEFGGPGLASRADERPAHHRHPGRRGLRRLHHLRASTSSCGGIPRRPRRRGATGPAEPDPGRRLRRASAPPT